MAADWESVLLLRDQDPNELLFREEFGLDDERGGKVTSPRKMPSTSPHNFSDSEDGDDWEPKPETKRPWWRYGHILITTRWRIPELSFAVT
uniref:Uncharacterized protein n=1 Tax=Timema poppense TaxID=170557 RepID=A0A7R9DLB1_TIMPO|nr:unnamed protein product [Timema poppensis]